ncbi:MAG: NAD-dependent epimerase/dehydratase family protein [Candidatus Thiodiazotropha taylori]|nr:NAD-dependent epimerase/dehydratase family protein [Candidatus Thiodiazotropha taylori]
MRVLITGATGFVGSHCIEALAKHQDVTTIAACRDPSRLPGEFRGEYRVGDLRDAHYLENLMLGVDTVVHAAAWTSLWGHRKQSDELFLKPSLALIDSARRQGVKRFIFISTVSAAAPGAASDPMSPGIKRAYWPHETNVVRIEDRLRKLSSDSFCAINLRLGLFAGSRYALGLLPILVPRLKTHLVPWVNGGETDMTIIDGRDIGQAVVLASTTPALSGYQSFNILGPEVPQVRQVIDYLHQQYGVPKPHFSAPFPLAFAFAWFMEKIDPLLPWEPLVTRSIVHLLEETNADNERASKLLGYKPRHHWQEAIDIQMAEMAKHQSEAMSMARPLPDGSGQ